MLPSMSLPEERLQRVREVLQAARHIALATVNIDGTPHNSPVFSAHNKDLHFVWSSHPESVHSQNILRTERAFIVVFDSMDKGGGLYIDADVKRVKPAQFTAALAVFNERRKAIGRDAASPEIFTTNPQCLYVAIPRKMWINVAEQDARGHFIRDRRYEIFAADII